MKVLVGFSGGADSMEAVRRLSEQGFDVEALTLDMTGDASLCDRARTAARHLGVPLRLIDVRQRFEHDVVENFVQEYLCGHTPAPCTRCNTHVKWPELLAVADREGFERIATGHYFRIERYEERFYVAVAADERKDQSYYLWGLSQEILRRTETPLGEAYKQEVMARHGNGASYRESMGVCFLRGGDYRSFLSKRSCLPGCGEVVDRAGCIVGRHDGFPFYTIGQKRGNGVPEGCCVVCVDADRNKLIVGKDSDLLHARLEVDGWCCVWPEELFSACDVRVKIRGVGRNPEGFARVERHGSRLRVLLDTPAWAPAPGQPVVFYRGRRVIGGGILCYSD